ncbi:MAG: D-alanyl-D-alanine carboxypeptidase [Selenomonadaceae bacterium]|nr:D-alanyl-D-alanine carboxypeptidase [Selenomonadaceae bacterium]
MWAVFRAATVICACIIGLLLSISGQKALAEEIPYSAQPVIISPDDKLPELTARSAILMDAATGQIIYARDAKSRRYPASTTKMMTLIVALEKGNVEDYVTVSRRAAGLEGSTLWLEPGDRMRLGDLLYGIMMMSGNDATVAIAEHIAGSEKAFVALMNEKAAAIGANNTHFVNPHGLPHEAHYTTAYDLAQIAAYGYQNPLFAEIVGKREQYFAWIKDPAHKWRNENQMLWLYEGVNGVKTGYTDLAGRCLVTGAKQKGVQLIAVVLDATYMWNDSIALLDYGFSKVKLKEFVARGKDMGKVPVRFGRQISVPVKAEQGIALPVIKGEEEKLRQVTELPPSVEAPIQVGDTLGAIKVFCQDREVARADLVATQSVERQSFFWTLWEWIRGLLLH